MKRKYLLKSIAFIVVAICGISHLSAQVKITQLQDSEFEKSNIQIVSDGKNEIGVISKEYVVINGVGTSMQLFYLPKSDRTIDFSVGYKVTEAGKVTFDATTGVATEVAVSESWNGGVFVATDNTASYASISGAKTGTTKPYLLEDVRGTQTETYPLVKVGSQVWTRENIRADYFNDGTAIDMIFDKNQWKNTSSPATTYYEKKAENKAKFGNLYNWKAIKNDKFAPAKWVVPTFANWQKLAKYIDPNGFVEYPTSSFKISDNGGTLLKSTDGWNTAGGTNATMLDIKPAGKTFASKWFDGYFMMGKRAYYWTRNTDNGDAMYISCAYDMSIMNVGIEEMGKFKGFSARFIANKPLKLAKSTTAINNSTELDAYFYVKNSTIKVIVPNHLLGEKLELFSVNGQKLLSQKLTQTIFSISALNKGLYIVKIGAKADKIIIK